MRPFSLIQFKKQSLGLIWLMLGVYVWLSSVAQLAHTDDLHAALIQAAVAAANMPGVDKPSQSANQPVAPMVIGNAARNAPDQPCAACEWVAAVHTASLPSVTVASLPVSYALVRAAHFENALLQRKQRIVTLRGPPAA